MGRGLQGVRWLALVVVSAGLLPACEGSSPPVRTPQGTPAARTVHVSPTGFAERCGTAAAPCGSIGAAYRAARPGDVIQVAAGRYPLQSITGPDRRHGAPVVVRPAPGAGVSAAGLSIERSNVTVRDIDLGKGNLVIRPTDVPGAPPVRDVTVDGVSGRNFDVLSATDVTVRGGQWGPTSACGGPHGGANNSIRGLPGEPVPAHIRIEATVIHGVQSYDLARCHTEGLAIFAGRDVTVSRSRFYGNSIYDIFIQANSGPIDHLLIENNWLDQPVDTHGRPNGSTLAFSGVDRDVTLRNNSLNGILSPDDNGENPRFVNFVVTGNIGALLFNGCSLRGITYSYNVWRNARCGATDVDLNGAPYPYGRHGYRLTGGPAVDLIPRDASPLQIDIDGDRRPQGHGIDAGADERARG